MAKSSKNPLSQSIKDLECRNVNIVKIHSFLHSVLRQGSFSIVIIIKIKTKTKRLEIFHVL